MTLLRTPPVQPRAIRAGTIGANSSKRCFDWSSARRGPASPALSNEWQRLGTGYIPIPQAISG